MILDYPNQPPRSTEDAAEIANLKRKGWTERPDPPQVSASETVRWENGAWVVDQVPLEDLRARIVAQITAAADDWVDQYVPPRKRERHQADFAVLNWLGDSKTPEQQARVIELLGVLSWVDSVDAAEAQAKADVAAMGRPELDAWTMPDLPGWQS